IGLMAGSLAHELNNPLTGLSMMSQLLMKDDQIPPHIKEDLKEIERAAVRCQDTVKNLLKFTNLELIEEDVVETTWKNIVDQTLPLLKIAMRYFNYENEVGDVGRIRVNSHLMGQVVFNLVNNACQAMTSDGTLTIGTTSEEGWSSLWIRDTGVGMDQAHVERIFEPFFTTKAKGAGTGIGLSLVQSILQRFGGKIEVASAVGTGSTFKVSLPRVDQ
ncbi:MAG: HAMP domain-containing histidine kinase, partial [Bdellovibrionales bacterium]|nr:HAMP domain-containing histidine kinase [Bdellovibrionales bacterium]